jgi:hypothetical protein
VAPPAEALVLTLAEEGVPLEEESSSSLHAAKTATSEIPIKLKLRKTAMGSS